MSRIRGPRGRWLARSVADDIARQVLASPPEAHPTNPFDNRPYRATPHLDGECADCAEGEAHEHAPPRWLREIVDRLRP